MTTKREIIDEAFAELGLGDAFNIPPADQQRALRRLDSLVAQWESRGIVLGYSLHADPADSTLDEEAGIAAGAVLALQMNLAIALAPSFGKSVASETRTAAKNALDDLFAQAAQPEQQNLRAGLPLGAGNKTWRSGQPFTQQPADALGDSATVLGV